MKLGRNRPYVRFPRLFLKNYTTLVYNPPIVSPGYRAKAMPALNQMYMNDIRADCVIAGMAHLEGVFTANAGNSPYIFTDAQILDLYGKIGGYINGQPNTDNGCDEQTALNFWQQNGLRTGEKITRWIAIDGTNKREIQTAISLFENLFFGIEMPNAWINPMPSPNFVWDVAGPANIRNGHCFVGVDYNEQGVQVCTWGMIGTITWEAIAKYATTPLQGELYCVLDQDMIIKATNKSPNGIYWNDLESNFQLMI